MRKCFDIKTWSFPLIFCLLCMHNPARSSGVEIQQADTNTMRIVFYNVENLFDIHDDPLTNDEEFTPEGQKKWTAYRYNKKLIDLSKVIMATGGWQAPDVIGLCEVENFQVLLDLISKTPLKAWNYRIIHENSPDARGIDVALLYRAEMISKISHQSIGIRSETGWKTRDILYARMQTLQHDTLHFYVNHWPSRIVGKERSEARRILVANTLRHHVDSLFSNVRHPKIIIMGDFNDELTDKSLKEALKALTPGTEILPEELYNLSHYNFKKGLGTLVYKEITNRWFLFDQFIVSGNLINGSGLEVKNGRGEIFNQSWLLRQEKPYRTYMGPNYAGGFSDHLAIFLDLYLKP